MRIGPYELNQIYTGDSRELSKAIPDESIDHIFTDPVYQNIDDYRWLSETAARVLRPGGDILVYYAQYHFVETIAAMNQPPIKPIWPLTEKKVGSGGIIWDYGLFCHTKPLLWCSKGKPRKDKNISRIDFTWATPDGSGVNHKWHKGTAKARQWLERFTAKDEIVWEPFCGGGSILAACKILNRPYLAFEIDPDTAELARQRVANTQPPLPITYHEQGVLL